MRNKGYGKNRLRPGVFLDRDGTINIDTGYLHEPEKLVLIPGSARAIRRLNRSGWIIACISNQSGVARGYFPIEAVDIINDKLKRLLAAKDAYIDGFYYCPHHPTEGNPPYRMACRCRKPETGMIEQAAAELHIDLSNSFLIGDHLSDIQAAHSTGLRSILVLTGHGMAELSMLRTKGIKGPDFIAGNLYDAVNWMLKEQ